MDIVPFLKKEAALWKEGVVLVNKRRQEWEDFERIAKSYFSSIITEARKQKLYENLYVHSAKDAFESKKMPNFITLFWGQHLTGEFEFEGDRKGQMVMERGCALHLSQLPSGEVIATFYPFQSTLSKPPRSYYVYKVYNGPKKIREKDLQRLVRIMFSLARNTTFARKVTFFDFWIINWLKVRTLFRDAWHKEWTNFIINKIGRALDSKFDELIKSDESSSNNAN